MNIVLVDDEKHALQYLSNQLQTLFDIEITGTYTDPLKAMEHILHETIDVVFLDIHMRDVNGIQLAEQLLERKPSLIVVFVTAHDDYAVEAFELNALDYILKPTSVKRLNKTVRRIGERLKKVTPDEASSNPLIQVKLFEKVCLQLADGTQETIRWRTAKTQEMFLFMLQNRGQLVRKSTIVELLWPEYEPDKAYSLLYTAVYYMRKTLEPYGKAFQLLNEADGYVLKLDKVMLDVELWEQGMKAGNDITERSIPVLEKLIELYDGDYLQEYDYWWAENERQRLRMQWLRLSIQLGEYYFTHQDYDRAVERFQGICRRYPLEEEAHFGLMKAYAQQGRRLLVHQQYQNLTELLQVEMEIAPSPYIADWYEKEFLNNP